VRTVAVNLPAPPRYFPHDAGVNREGPADLAPLLAALRPLPPREVERLSRDGAAVLLDTRAAKEFGQGHLPGSVNVGIDGRYAAWVGTVLDPRSPFLLIAPPGREAEAAMRLGRVGYDNVLGYLDGGIAAWQGAGLPVRDLPQIEVRELARRVEAGSVRVVDVRGSGEWESGHIASATHLDLQRLAEDLKAPVQGGGPVAVICGSGYRSSIACSILERAGVDLPLLNVVGGMTAWSQADLPVAR
jgi:hydroxyacylglutathione hydrolase